MTWFVFLEDWNRKSIIKYNVFEHCSFHKEAIKLRKQRGKITCKEFSEKLKRQAMYYFWSKSEYEVIITDWPGFTKECAEKISIYDQLELNWDEFAKYVYNYTGKKANYHFI